MERTRTRSPVCSLYSCDAATCCNQRAHVHLYDVHVTLFQYDAWNKFSQTEFGSPPTCVHSLCHPVGNLASLPKHPNKTSVLPRFRTRVLHLLHWVPDVGLVATLRQRCHQHNSQFTGVLAQPFNKAILVAGDPPVELPRPVWLQASV